jgi:peptidoglycan/xylan/chitin deacetylase (PgdA/CDA1 family)
MTLKDNLLLTLSKIVQPLYGGLGHILMLHRVTPDLPKRVPGQSHLEITPQRLEEIIRFFQARKYDFLALDDLPERLGGQNAQKFVIFTFDDGYADNLAHALPVFQRFSIPFTIYVTVSFPRREAVLWWYLLDDLILGNSALSFELPDGPLTLACGATDEKVHASRTLRALLKFCPPEQYPLLLEAIFGKYGLDMRAKTAELALSWEQIRQLSREPLVTIGSHSLRHFPLKILSEQEARHEISESKRLLEEQIGRSVLHFAYPYGEHREAGPREFELVRQSGFRTAVTTRFASLYPQHAGHLEALPRFDAPALSGARWELAVNGLLPMRRNRFRRVIFE